METTERFKAFDALVATFAGLGGFAGEDAVAPVGLVPAPGPQGDPGDTGDVGVDAFPALNGLNGDAIYPVPTLAQGAVGSNGNPAGPAPAALVGLPPALPPTYFTGSISTGVGGITSITTTTSVGVTVAANSLVVPTSGYYEFSVRVAAASLPTITISTNSGPSVIIPARSVSNVTYGLYLTTGTTVGFSAASSINTTATLIRVA